MMRRAAVFAAMLVAAPVLMPGEGQASPPDADGPPTTPQAARAAKEHRKGIAAPAEEAQPEHASRRRTPLGVKLEPNGKRVSLVLTREAEVEVWVGRQQVQRCAMGERCDVTEAVKKAGRGSLRLVCRDSDRYRYEKTLAVASFAHSGSTEHQGPKGHRLELGELPRTTVDRAPPGEAGAGPSRRGSGKDEIGAVAETKQPSPTPSAGAVAILAPAAGTGAATDDSRCDGVRVDDSTIEATEATADVSGSYTIRWQTHPRATNCAEWVILIHCVGESLPYSSIHLLPDSANAPTYDSTAETFSLPWTRPEGMPAACEVSARVFPGDRQAPP